MQVANQIDRIIQLMEDTDSLTGSYSGEDFAISVSKHFLNDKGDYQYKVQYTKFTSKEGD